MAVIGRGRAAGATAAASSPSSTTASLTALASSTTVPAFAAVAVRATAGVRVSIPALDDNRETFSEVAGSANAPTQNSSADRKEERITYPKPPEPENEGKWGRKLSKIPPYTVARGGYHLLQQPLLNKGSAWTHAERDRLNLRGMLPAEVAEARLQMDRVMAQYSLFDRDISKYTFLSALQDNNEVLYYKVLAQHIKDMLSIVYTPTVGEACEKFGTIFRRARGMFFSWRDRFHLSTMVYNWPYAKVDVIVVTDGSRILGLGDLGAHGMGIPIGKLALYVVCGGIHPARTLPCLLDVGTNNTNLLNNRFYMGSRHTRVEGEDYLDFVDEWMQAIKFRWPNALIQFEDFSNANARRLLDRYRDDFLCFNDDIQGTGSVALAGLLSALRMQGKETVALRDQKVLCVGAGSAGLGVCDAIVQGMVHEGAETREAAYRQFYLVDKDGLLGNTRPTLDAHQEAYARPDLADGMKLVDVVKAVKPDVLLGLSGVGGAFEEEAVREMAKHVDRPVVFPLSNPSSHSECTTEQACAWTDGRAIVATGSPFAPVEHNGKSFVSSQGNNVLVYPGIGAGAVAVHAKSVTDSMLYAASKAVAAYLTKEDMAKGFVYPSVADSADVGLKVAIAVARDAISTGNTRMEGVTVDDAEELVTKRRWVPQYVPIVEDAHHAKKTFG